MGFNLSDKIWKTKKARANASTRLKNNEVISQCIIIYYSLFIIILSIFDMKHDYVNTETLTLALSIIILVVSVFIMSMDYKSRANKLLTLSIKLDKLYAKACEHNCSILTDDNKLKCNKIHDKYTSLLESSENQENVDYLKVRHEVKDNKKYKDTNSPFTIMDYFMHYLFYPGFKLFIILFFISIPILILVAYCSLGLI